MTKIDKTPEEAHRHLYLKGVLFCACPDPVDASCPVYLALRAQREAGQHEVARHIQNCRECVLCDTHWETPDEPA